MLSILFKHIYIHLWIMTIKIIDMIRDFFVQGYLNYKKKKKNRIDKGIYFFTLQW